MIQSMSRVKVADNSGAKWLGVIKVVKQGRHDGAQLGDVVVGSVKVAIPRANVKAKEIVRAVIVRQTKPYRRKDGSTIRFDDNAVVIVNPDGTPRGTRIFGPIAREIRDRGYLKIVSQAPEVL